MPKKTSFFFVRKEILYYISNSITATLATNMFIIKTVTVFKMLSFQFPSFLQQFFVSHPASHHQRIFLQKHNR